MAIHYYDESPSGPAEQIARLGPPSAVVNANIPCVVWAEDALSIIHRVPTCLFDQQLLVPPDFLDAAIKAICASHPYVYSESDESDQWKDNHLFNPDRPYAFNLNTSTKLLLHLDPKAAWEKDEPQRILVHDASVYHFDISDPSRTCFNPEPPSKDSQRVLFPTLHAFYDALADTYHEPPLPFIHFTFRLWLGICQGYLSQYTLSDRGIMWSRDASGKHVLIDACLELLEKVKEENRPFLARHFLSKSAISMESSYKERMILKQDRFHRMGIPYQPPRHGVPYNPYHLRKGISRPAEEFLTPYLIQNSSGKLALDWRPLI